MTKVTLSDIQNLTNEQTAIGTINANSEALETFSDSVLSRDGTTPNTMEAELDMNSNAIINLPSPTTDTEPVRLTDFLTGFSGSIDIDDITIADATITNNLTVGGTVTIGGEVVDDAAFYGVSNDVTLADSSATDLVTENAAKTYIDNQVAVGAVDLDPVEAATTAAGTLASDFENGDTLDGVTLATGDRILIKNQADASENGIYTVEATGAPTRATDNDESTEFVRRQVLVLGGTANASTKWKCSNLTAPVVDTDDITWVQTQAANSYTAGFGLDLTSQEFSVDLDDIRSVPKFDTTTDAAAADISSYSRIYVEGYASLGDGGHGHWRNIGTSPPAHTARFQDAGNDWWEPDEEVVNPRMFGMLLDGSTDDRTAWQAVVAMINTGDYKDILIPPGVSRISGAVLTEITASNFRLRGSGSGVTLIEKTGTTNGNLFVFGSAETTAREFYFGEMNIDFSELSGLVSGIAVNLNNVNRGFVKDLTIDFCAHGIGLGHVANGTDCRQSSVNGFRCLLKNEAGGAAINDVGSNNFKMEDFSISNFDDTTNHQCRGIWIHPGAGRGGDAWKVINGEINITNGNGGYALEIDASEEHVGNRVFTNVVFDRAEIASVYLHIDANHGTDSDNHTINVGFANCIMDAGNTAGSGAVCFKIENRATDGSFIVVRATGCQLTTNPGEMIQFLGPSEKRVAFLGCEFKNRGTSNAADSCITGLGTSVRGTIIGCYVANDITQDGTPMVQPEFFLGAGSTANLKVPQASNDFSACSGGFQE